MAADSPSDRPPPLPEGKDRLNLLELLEPPLKSEADIIRARLLEARIDPDNVPPGMIADLDFFPATHHAEEVACVIRCTDHGVIHNATIKQIRIPDPTSYIELNSGTDGLEPLKRFIINFSVKALNGMSAFLDLYDMQDGPRKRVLNMSVGMSRTEMYKGIMNYFETNPEKYQPLIRQLVGEQGSNDKLYQAIVNYVDKQLDAGGEYKSALRRYQQVTREVAKHGVTLVVALGNDGNFDEVHHVKTQPGSAFNWLAMSPYVIAVGGSDSHKATPGDLKNYRIASFSPAGTHEFHPTVVAPAVQVPVGQIYEPGRAAPAPDLADGLSYAAPLTSSIVALMLVQNPRLTFQQQKELLQKNAVRLPGEPETVQGAGTVDGAASVMAVRKLVGSMSR